MAVFRRTRSFPRRTPAGTRWTSASCSGSWLLRQEFGFPLIITSAYRSPAHNAKVGGRPRSAHLAGRAVDIAISGDKAHRLVRMALLFGFTGIGIRQRGDFRSRYVHLDDLDKAPGIPRPAIWSY